MIKIKGCDMVTVNAEELNKLNEDIAIVNCKQVFVIQDDTLLADKEIKDEKENAPISIGDLFKKLKNPDIDVEEMFEHNPYVKIHKEIRSILSEAFPAVTMKELNGIISFEIVHLFAIEDPGNFEDDEIDTEINDSDSIEEKVVKLLTRIFPHKEMLNRIRDVSSNIVHYFDNLQKEKTGEEEESKSTKPSDTQRENRFEKALEEIRSILYEAYPDEINSCIDEKISELFANLTHKMLRPPFLNILTSNNCSNIKLNNLERAIANICKRVFIFVDPKDIALDVKTTIMYFENRNKTKTEEEKQESSQLKKTDEMIRESRRQMIAERLEKAYPDLWRKLIDDTINIVCNHIEKDIADADRKLESPDEEIDQYKMATARDILSEVVVILTSMYPNMPSTTSVELYNDIEAIIDRCETEVAE